MILGTRGWRREMNDRDGVAVYFARQALRSLLRTHAGPFFLAQGRQHRRPTKFAQGSLTVNTCYGSIRPIC